MMKKFILPILLFTQSVVMAANGHCEEPVGFSDLSPLQQQFMACAHKAVSKIYGGADYYNFEPGSQYGIQPNYAVATDGTYFDQFPLTTGASVVLYNGSKAEIRTGIVSDTDGFSVGVLSIGNINAMTGSRYLQEQETPVNPDANKWTRANAYQIFTSIQNCMGL